MHKGFQYYRIGISPDLQFVNDKIVGISFEELKNAPHVIVAAGGVDKTQAIYAALKGKIINTLITDSRIAEKLLAMDDRRNRLSGRSNT